MRGASSAWMLLTLLAVAGCGGRKEETPYGGVEEVRRYREQIDRVIDEVNAIQTEMERTAVGSSGRATGRNLSEAYERLAPRLKVVLEKVDRIEPPSELAELHRRIREVILLRLQALERAAEGWRVEKETSSFEKAESFYEEAEERFDRAAALAAQVNEELEEIDLSLARTGGGNPVG